MRTIDYDEVTKGIAEVIKYKDEQVLSKYCNIAYRGQFLGAVRLYKVDGIIRKLMTTTALGELRFGRNVVLLSKPKKPPAKPITKKPQSEPSKPITKKAETVEVKKPTTTSKLTKEELLKKYTASKKK